jgi:hypothetical protein
MPSPQPSPPDLSGAVWHTSTRSQDADSCVAVARNIPGIVAVRDSKVPAGPTLVFTPGAWRAFTAALSVTA